MNFDKAGHPRDHSHHARSLREEGEIEAAGEHYVASGFGHLMQFRRISDENSIFPQMFGRVTQMLFLGALCFRITGNRGRSRRYCSIAIEVISDFRQDVPGFLQPTGEARTGLCHELEGDFRTVGGTGDAELAYDEAVPYYEPVENTHQWSVEPEFELPMLVLEDLGRSVGVEFSAHDFTDPAGSLVDRIEFKREHFGTIVEGVIEDGNWESDRW